MGEITYEQFQAVFGIVDRIDSRLQNIQGEILRWGQYLGNLNSLGAHTDYLKKTVDLLKDIHANSKNNKPGEPINFDSISTSINESTTKAADKVSSVIAANFIPVNKYLSSLTNSRTYSSQDTALQEIRIILEEQLMSINEAIYDLQRPQEKKKTAVRKDTRRDGSTDLLRNQLTVLEAIKISVDKKMSSILEVVSKTDERSAKRDKKEKYTPPEINLSKKDRKMLGVLNYSDKFDNLTKEIKSAKDADSKSPLMRILSPFLILLGGLAGLAFGVMKFPKIRELAQGFMKTGLGSNIMQMFAKITPKGMPIKDFIRSIPFIGRFIDLYDALSLMHQGKMQEGFKQLSFVVPGMEYIAILLGTTKKRLLQPYDAQGDKSVKIPFTNTTFEQIFQKGFSAIGEYLGKGVTFFVNAFGSLGEVLTLLSKGGDINFNDISTSLDKISDEYFPALKPVAKIFKSLAKSTFDWTAKRMKGDTKVDKETGEIVPIDMGDVMSNMWERINEVFTTISTKIQEAFNSVTTLLGALGMIFSNDRGTQLKGLGILEEQGMGGLADGISMFLNVVDSVKNIAGEDGNIGIFDMVKGIYSGIDVTSGPYSRKARRTAMFETKEDREAYGSISTDVKKMDELTEQLIDLRNKPVSDDMSLREKFGWTLEDFLFPVAYREKMANAISKQEKEKQEKELLDQILKIDPSLRTRAAELQKKSGKSIALPAYEYEIPELKKQQEKQYSEPTGDNASEPLIMETRDDVSAIARLRETRFTGNDQIDMIQNRDTNYRSQQEENFLAAIQKNTEIFKKGISLWEQIAFSNKEATSYLQTLPKLATAPRSNTVINNSPSRTNVFADSDTTLSFLTRVNGGVL